MEEESVKQFLFDNLDPLLREYVEREAEVVRDRSISYSVVEIAKLDVADWLLRFLGVTPDFQPRRELTEPEPFYSKIPIPRWLRWEVWVRDNFTCKTCGARRDLAIDHILAESRGGKAEMDNLQTLCRRCNSIKGAR